jgi:hypothetical protein
MRVRNTRNSGLLALAAAAAVAGMGIATQVRGDAIDLQLSTTTDGQAVVGTGTTSPNLGITPTSYTPSLIGIPYAPSATYDAADTSDSGTQWNQLLAPGLAGADVKTFLATVTFQANLPLADSAGTPTTAKIGYIALVEGSGKSDSIHNFTLAAPTGTDLLTANPTELMTTGWDTNSTSETIIFQLTGLTANSAYSLYEYGGDQGNVGCGATYTLAAANQGVGYNSSTGAYTVNPSATSGFHSVFSASGGNNPTPEQGLSWVLLPAKADANGNLQIFVNEDHGSTIKAFTNGFGIDGTFTLVPEPASIGLLGAAALGLLSRRRRED